MESHDEKLHNMIKASKELEAREESKRKEGRHWSKFV